MRSVFAEGGRNLAHGTGQAIKRPRLLRRQRLGMAGRCLLSRTLSQLLIGACVRDALSERLGETGHAFIEGAQQNIAAYPALLVPSGRGRRARGRRHKAIDKYPRCLTSPFCDAADDVAWHVEIEAAFILVETQPYGAIPDTGHARECIVVPVLHGRDDAAEESA